MDEIEFKKQNMHPACTKRPWEYLIPEKIRYETVRQVDQECIEIYGQKFDECAKRMMCFTKKCIGRPLEWKSPTARPYLEQFAKAKNIPVDGEYFIKNCDECPIARICKKPCEQVNNYMNRSMIVEPIMFNRDKTDNLEIHQENMFIPANSPLLKEQVPWDILSEKRKQIVKKYLYENKDFKFVADQVGINNQARAKYEFYSALTTLSEYAVMRKFLAESFDQLSEKQFQVLNFIYNGNKTLTQAAEEFKISKQAAQQLLSRVLKKHSLKWTIFVKKRGNKVIYNVPEVLK